MRGERRYTLDEVAEAERWAWASSDEGNFHFDGAVFWYDARGEGHVVASADSIPREGWRHAEDCLCQLCRPARRR